MMWQNGHHHQPDETNNINWWPNAQISLKTITKPLSLIWHKIKLGSTSFNKTKT